MLRSMTEPRILATGVTSYPQLVHALRERVQELRVAGETLDEASGLPKGYCAKLLSPRPARRLGMISLGSLLNTLGLQLAVLEDPVATRKYKHLLDKRNETVVRVLAVKSGRGKHTLTSVRLLRKIASDGGAARAAKLGPRRRKQIARQAAVMRWDAVRAAAKG
jgi:hypothetical protein